MDPFRAIDYYDSILIDEVRIPSRLLRDAQDPFALDEQKFKKRYRFTPSAVKDIILPLMYNGLVNPDQRGCPIAPELQILVCLRFYATASFQIVCGDLLNLSQPVVSKIIKKVSHLLAHQLCQRFIKYPQDMQNVRRLFNRLGQIGIWPGLPSIDGAVDCVHIKIVHTPGVQHHEAYRNRKSFFSVNVQAIAGPTGQFMDIVARWAGSTHDSRIFQMSSVNLKYREGQHSGYLVGDSGYPSLRYLLTPKNPPTNLAEERYNKAHIKTRNVVERMFGMWKRRFPCLTRGLGNKLTTVADIIVACAILHNIAMQINDDMPDEVENEDIDLEIETPYIADGSNEGFAVRSALINRLYS